MVSRVKQVNLSWDIVFSMLTAGTCMLFLMYVALTGDLPVLN